MPIRRLVILTFCLFVFIPIRFYVSFASITFNLMSFRLYFPVHVMSFWHLVPLDVFSLNLFPHSKFCPTFLLLTLYFDVLLVNQAVDHKSCWLHQLLATAAVGYSSCWLQQLLATAAVGHSCWLQKMLTTGAVGYTSCYLKELLAGTPG
jgi:hypothetical protein